MTATTCRLDGCAGAISARGLCSRHYQRARKYGHPHAVSVRGQRMTLTERIWSKFVRDRSGCWLWTATSTDHGYGLFAVGGRGGGMMAAHRVMYELVIGPIPDGLVLDHLCRTPACVNPAHLEPVTQAENLRRGREYRLTVEHLDAEPAA